jgi:tetratricopeptide (TPR) repeat protein
MPVSPQLIFRTLLIVLLVTQCSFGLSGTVAQGSDGDREVGISLYEKKDYQQASQLLRRAVRIQKDDLTAWHYLGLALEASGLTSEASQAHQKAAKLGSSLVIAEMKRRANWVSAFRPDSSQIIQAAASADRYIELSKSRGSELDEWTERSMSLRELAEFASRNDNASSNLYTGKEVTIKARVLDVPPPEYRSEDQAHSVTVVLRGIFTADGHVRAIFPLESDYYQGFGGACIKAARKIRFTPATKDGKPVSMYMEFQYNLNR